MISVQLESAAMWETIEEALKAAIMAQGGFKVMGSRLWPDAAPDTNARKLAHCVDPTRNERLSPSQVVFVLRGAREIGYHEPMNFFAADIGYKAEPVTEQDQMADMHDEFKAGLIAMADLTARMERAAKRVQGGARKGVQ